MIVYKSLAQVSLHPILFLPIRIQLYFTMSSIYHPQNAYCIAVDGKSSQTFKDGVRKLATCFPNITIVVRVSLYVLRYFCV
jgi:hypothetical protein